MRIWKKASKPDRAKSKPVDELTLGDLTAFPVWEYANDDEGLPGQDETWVGPVPSLPVADLSNRIAAVPVLLAGGKTMLGALSNVSLDDPYEREHFLVIALYRPDGERFDLARYHDLDRSERGPQQLADFLGLPLQEVFPISYDLSSVAVGQSSTLCGAVEAEPRNPLSQRELIRLAVR